MYQVFYENLICSISPFAKGKFAWADVPIEMKMDQRYEQGRKKGRNEGEQNRDKELITKWLQKGKSIAEIAENLDRTEEYVKKFM